MACYAIAMCVGCMENEAAHTRVFLRQGGHKSTLKCLHVGTGLDQFPGAICQLTALETLHLFGGNAPEIPPEIGNLTRLTELEIAGFPNLRRLPDTISNLVSMRRLVLNICPQMCELPTSVSQLYQACQKSAPLPPPPRARTDKVGHVMRARLQREPRVAKKHARLGRNIKYHTGCPAVPANHNCARVAS
jgi:hypothetical protein